MDTKPLASAVRPLFRSRWAVVWTVVFALFACAHGMEEGTDALSAEDYDRAESIAEDELDEAPDSPWANQLMAETLVARGAHRRALPYAERADEAQVFPVRTPRVLGEIHGKLGNPVDAARYYRRARQAAPHSVDDATYVQSLEEAVQYAATRGDHETRWHLVNWLSDVDSDHPDASGEALAVARRARAIELRRDGEYFEAVELLEQALDGDPDHRRGEALDLGEIYARLDMSDDAVRAWELYLSEDVDPQESWQRHLDVADHAARYNLIAVAVETLEDLPDEIDNPARRDEVLLQLARYQLRANMGVEARQTLDEYLRATTSGADDGQASPVPYQRAAETAGQLSNTRLEITLLERAIEEAEPNRDITSRLADIYARRAQLDSVEETLERFIERSEDTVEAQLVAGRWARDRNNYRLAHTFFARAVDNDDIDVQAWYWLAEVQGELEDPDAMARTLDTYVERRGEVDDALSQAAELLADYRMYDEAERFLLQLQQRAPQRRSVTRQLAGLYDDWSKPDEAAGAWQDWIEARGNDPDDMISVAHLRVRSGDLQRGAELFEQAASLGDVESWLRAADIHFRRERPDELVRTVDRYLDEYPDRSQALEEAARRWGQASMYSRQIDALTELVELDRHSWDAHQRLARLLMDRGQSAEALDQLQHYVDHADEPLAALQRIGSAFGRGRHGTKLLAFFTQWEGDESVQPDIFQLIGNAYRVSASDAELGETGTDYARRRARSYYLDFLEATKDDNRDWQQIAGQFSRDQMWRPAAIAYERADQSPSTTRHHALAHAEALLHLGDNDRAVTLLEDHYQRQQRRPDLAGRIARLFGEFSLYDHAEEYAQDLFLSTGDSNVDAGFQLLAEIHKQREDYDSLHQLASDYLDRASHTTRVRRTVTTLLGDAGQWPEAAEHLGEFDLSALHQFNLEMGFHYYRAGDHERASRAFEEAAYEANEPEAVWTEAGQFYEARGDFDAAQNAYRRAIDANPDDIDSRIARGTFAIRRGDIEDGWSDYEFARQSRSTLRGSGRQQFFEAFASSGDFQHARTVAAHFAEDSQTPPGELRQTLGQWQLRSPDPDQRRQGYEDISANTWGQFRALQFVDEAGHHDLILELIEEEFDQGDATTAGVLLLNRLTPLSRLRDWPQQRDLLAPVVDPLQRGEGRLLGPIGDFRARTGDLDDAQLYLRAAVDEGRDEYQPQYAHTRLLLGDRQAAFEQFEQWLFKDGADSQKLESILLRFESAGDADGAREFLERLVRIPSQIDITLPYKIHYDLEMHGDPRRAADEIVQTIESFRELSPAAFGDHSIAGDRRGLSRDDVFARATLRSLEVIASLGHTEIIAETIDELDNLEAHQRDELRLKIALTTGDVDTAAALADELVEATEDNQQRQQLRLRLAERFISAGIDTPAKRLVDDALADQTDFGSHAPFALKLGLRIIAGDSDVSEAIDDYLARVPNRHHARSSLIDDLYRMGRDGEALRLVRRTIELRPTTDNLRRGIDIALDDGNRQALLEFIDRLFDVADDPAAVLEADIATRLTGVEAHLALPIVERIRSTRPRDIGWMLQEAEILFTDGQVQPARQLIDDILSASNYHRDAVTRVVHMLYEQRLYVELSRIVAPDVPDDALWPRLVIVFAEADFALGFEEDALAWLDRLSEVTDNPDMWRLELGEQLATRQLFEAIGPTLEPMDTSDDTVPFADYLTGLYRLATGDDVQGLQLLHRANTRGVDRYWTHYAGTQAALMGELPDTAAQLIGEMAQMPIRENNMVSLPLQMVLTAAMNLPGGPAAIRDGLERNRPRLVDGYGATWREFIGQLASSFEHTGDPQGAYGFYRDRIWRAHLVDDDPPLATYLNNLAYSYATTDAHIDRGLDKIRRAIVLRGERTPSFIDTLGWLMYRAGDLEGAEQEIRRALRGYTGSPSGLHDLLDHLQTVTYERGIYDEATDITTHQNRLPPPGIDW